MEKSAVYSQYHKEVHKIFYAVFGFYCRTLYTVRVFCDNNNEVVAKQISYTNGNKDEFVNKELFINLWNSVSEEEGISFHSRDFSHFEVGEYQYPASTLGKHSLADYVFLKKGFFGVRDDFKIDTFELSESFKRIIITKDLKIDDTSGLLLAEICKIYLSQDYKYKEVSYDQFVEKYKTTAQDKPIEEVKRKQYDTKGRNKIWNRVKNVYISGSKDDFISFLKGEIPNSKLIWKRIGFNKHSKTKELVYFIAELFKLDVKNNLTYISSIIQQYFTNTTGAKIVPQKNVLQRGEIKNIEEIRNLFIL